MSFEGGVPGKTIRLRLADIKDAEFILGLRSDSALNRFLSAVVPNLVAQEQWLEAYKLREILGQEYYFIIESLDGSAVGTVRLYDFRGNSFCWGSWIVRPGAPRKTAIESAILVYEVAFYTLGFSQSHFDVRRDNTRVVAFHERFGACITHTDNIDVYFTYSKGQYDLDRLKYRRFIA